MIVCLCACVSEAEIIEEIKKGYDTVDLLADRLNVTTTCGTCLPDVERLISLHAKKPFSLQFIKIEK